MCSGRRHFRGVVFSIFEHPQCHTERCRFSETRQDSSRRDPRSTSTTFDTLNENQNTMTTSFDKTAEAEADDTMVKTIHDETVVAAMQVSSEADKSTWRLVRENPRAVLLAFLANCGSLLFGFDVLVQGAVTALPAFS